jgi:hypothetical protein
LISCIVTIGAFGQTSIKIDAPRQVSLSDSYFQVKYTINTVKSSRINVPQIRDFKLLAQPSKSVYSRVVNFNGQKQSTSGTTYTLTLQPHKLGKCVIPPISINTSEGKVIKSAEVSLTVSDRRNNNSTSSSSQIGNSSPQANKTASSKDLFIRVVANKKVVCEQEPVLLSYKFYCNDNVDLKNIAPERKPDFSGMLSQEIPVRKIMLDVERVGGQLYATGTCLKYVIFPNKSGNITIPGVTFDCYIANRSHMADPIAAFFNNGGQIGDILKCQSSDININVKPLPQPQPAGFNGAVGNMTLSGALVTDSVKSNEVCIYRVVLSGVGNLKTVSAPELKLPDGFDVFSPKVNDNLKTTSQGVEGNVVYEYTFVPRSPGNYEIPPVELVYFDLDAEDYKVLRTPAVPLKVAKGNKTDEEYMHEKNLLNTGIREIQEGDENDSWMNHTPWYVFLIAYFCLGVLTILSTKVLSRCSNSLLDNQGKRQSKAGHMAVKRMRQAERMINSQNEKDFYAEVIRALYAYLSDKFGVGLSVLNREYISTELLNDIDENVRITFIKILEECEMAQYSVSLSELTKEQIYKNAIDAIVSMEEYSKK